MTETDDANEREAITRAANAYDRLNRQIESLKADLHAAKIDIEAKQARIDQLLVALSEERTKGQTLEEERDRSMQERTAVATLFNNLKMQINSFEIAVPVLPTRTHVHDVARAIEDEVQEVSTNLKEQNDE